MKSLALASKAKSLARASKPQVLENCSVLGLRTALFFCTIEIMLEKARNLAENLQRPFLFSAIGNRLNATLTEKRAMKKEE